MSTEDTGAPGAPASPSRPSGPGAPSAPGADGVPGAPGNRRAPRTDYRGQVIALQSSLLDAERRATNAENRARAASAERRAAEAERRATEAELQARAATAEGRATEAERRATEAERQATELQARATPAERRPLEPQVEQETNQYIASVVSNTRELVKTVMDKVPPQRIFEVFASSHSALAGGLDIGRDSNIRSSGRTTRVSGTHPPLSSNGDLRSRQLKAIDTFLQRVPLNDTFMNSKDESYTEAIITGTPALLDEYKLVQKWCHDVMWPLSSFMKNCEEKHYLDGVYNIGKCVTFQNRVTAMRSQGPIPHLRPNATKFRPDHICSFKRTDEQNESIAFLIEYKALHKVSLLTIRQGLARLDPGGPHRDIISGISDPQELERLDIAKKTVSRAITQVYKYLHLSKQIYGCIVTGKAILFLQLGKENGSRVIFYHLVVPDDEVVQNGYNICRYSALSWMVGITIVALHDANTRRIDPALFADDGNSGNSHSHHSRNTSVRSAPAAPGRPPITRDSRRPGPSGASEGVPGGAANRELTEHDDGQVQCDREIVEAAAGNAPTTRDLVNFIPQDHSDGADGDGTYGDSIMCESYAPSMPTAVQDADPKVSRQDVQAARSDGATLSRQDSYPNRPYCTQKCLLGLVSKGILDNECPNVDLHRAIGGGDYHPIDHKTWLDLVRNQLSRRLEHSLLRTGKEGATGFAFRVTLVPHGYTFVAKGTIPEFAKYLKHETKVYRRLQAVQGYHVPVYLGDYDIPNHDRGYFIDFDAILTYFLFMSWGGSTFVEVKKSICREEAESSLLKALRALHRHGVIHEDVRDANVVWNEGSSNRRAMLIDFERSLLCPRPQYTMVPQKRLRDVASEDSAPANGNTGADINFEAKAYLGQVDLNLSPEMSYRMQQDIHKAKELFE